MPDTHEYHGWAYSLHEAAMQAIVDASGRIPVPETKYQIEFAGPDLPAYMAAFPESIAAKAHAGRP